MRTIQVGLHITGIRLEKCTDESFGLGRQIAGEWRACSGQATSNRMPDEVRANSCLIPDSISDLPNRHSRCERSATRHRLADLADDPAQCLHTILQV